MGSYWGYPTRKGLIAELTQSEILNKDLDQRRVQRTCLASCYRGCRWSGVLWSVIEITETDLATQITQTRAKFIQCDVLMYRGGEWGYKPLTEQMGPYTYSCPLKYLEMVPIAKYGGSPEWRDAVRRYHERSLARRRERRKIRQEIYGA